MTRVIDFNANYGQHMAIMAAFERVRGDVIITLDADLQNPPEEIPKLLEQIAAGHDYVGGYRLNRQDSLFRTYASKIINFVREKTTSIEMTDQGCMLRAYSRQVIDAIVRSGAINTFIPALAYSFASNPAEVGVKHEERHAGVSNYSFYMLIRLNFDLITGFSLAPLQYFTMFAGLCSAGSFVLVLVLAYMRIFLHDDTNGVFTLFGILFFLLSVTMVGIGLIGEYVGRTYQVVRARQQVQAGMFGNRHFRARADHAGAEAGSDRHDLGARRGHRAGAGGDGVGDRLRGVGVGDEQAHLGGSFMASNGCRWARKHQYPLADP